MPYEFGCAGCRTVLSLPSHIPGAVVTCPQCGTRMQLPAAAPPITQPAPATQASPSRRMARTFGILVVTAIIALIGIGLAFVTLTGGPQTKLQESPTPVKPASIDPKPKEGVARVLPEPKPAMVRIEPVRPKDVAGNPPVPRPEAAAPPARIEPKEVARELAVAKPKHVTPIKLEFLGDTHIKMTCVDSNALWIRRVILNSEFNAYAYDEKNAEMDRLWVLERVASDSSAGLRALAGLPPVVQSARPPGERRYPVKLGIGDCVFIGWRPWHPGGQRDYQKAVIHLDVVTDRGTFRFNTEGDLIRFEPPGPSTLEETVLDEATHRWEEAQRVASSKRPARAAEYLRAQRREIITDLAKKYGLPEQKVRAIVLP